MKNFTNEIIDLALTQAIEGYIEMEPEAAYEAIVAEWHEQLAVMLVEFFFKTTCGSCAGIPDFIQLPREQGGSNYIVPMCSCNWGAK
jgi:hypothetical protein